jgi:pimeloyl-ACP methyl ester carboxylesterase
MLDSYGLNSAMFSLGWFYKKGYDILLYTLPFHGHRKDWLHPFSGFGFFAHGFAHINEAMLQSVYDLRILMNYLEHSGVTKMGISGLSLGGYISALTACADSRPAFVIPNAPAVSLADMVREWAPMSRILGQIMPRNGISIRKQRHYMAIHTPLTYQPKVDTDRLLIIGGAGDRFTPPRYVKLLHEHWAGSQMHWFPGNHIMHLKKSNYLHLMKRFMDDCCT